MSETIKVNPENFGKKQTINFNKSDILDSFIKNLIENEISKFNKDLDKKYNVGLLDFNGSEKLSDSEIKIYIERLNKLVELYNLKIKEVVENYSFISNKYEKEIKNLLSSAGLNIENIKFGVENKKEIGLGNIAYYARGGGLDERIKKAGL